MHRRIGLRKQNQYPKMRQKIGTMLQFTNFNQRAEEYAKDAYLYALRRRRVFAQMGKEDPAPPERPHYVRERTYIK